MEGGPRAITEKRGKMRGSWGGEGLVLFRTRLTVQNPVKLVSARGDISRRILKQLQTNISI